MERNEILQAYKSELERVGKSQKTIDGYLFNVGMFLDWMEQTSGEAFTGSITPTDTRYYKAHLDTVKKAAPSTINTKLSAIQNFCDFLSSAYDMTPVKVEKKKGKHDPKVEVLTQQEMYQFMKYVDNNASLLHKAIVYTFIFTGIRESELCNLELDDVVNLDSTKNTEIIIRNGKGGKYRTIPIKGDCKQILREYIEHRPLTDSNKVFIGNRGTLTPNGIYKTVHRLGLQKNLNVYPHMLRHQYLTGLAKNCHNLQDIKDLSEIAGHATPEVTMKYYISGSAENKKRITEGLDYFS